MLSICEYIIKFTLNKELRLNKCEFTKVVLGATIAVAAYHGVQFFDKLPSTTKLALTVATTVFSCIAISTFCYCKISSAKTKLIPVATPKSIFLTIPNVLMKKTLGYCDIKMLGCLAGVSSKANEFAKVPIEAISKPAVLKFIDKAGYLKLKVAFNMGFISFNELASHFYNKNGATRIQNISIVLKKIVERPPSELKDETREEFYRKQFSNEFISNQTKKIFNELKKNPEKIEHLEGNALQWVTKNFLDV